jgi:preprotein translocase subunit YajC
VNALPLLLLVGLFAIMMLITQRNRRRSQAREATQRESIGVGTDVMTTSGLYGTVTELHDDATVTMSIAPGVEVKWALAALRDVASLPTQYRAALDGHDDGSHDADPRVSDPDETTVVSLDKDDQQGPSSRA